MIVSSCLKDGKRVTRFWINLSIPRNSVTPTTARGKRRAAYRLVKWLKA